MTEIKRVGVLGCGLMGSGIAQVAASAGYDTVVRDVSKEIWDRARAAIEKSLAKFVEKGKLPAASRAVEHRVASVPDIDKAMQLGCGYPMGPLTLLDFVGLDTTYKIAEIMFTEYREPRYAPPPLLRRMVIAGMNGRKSGKGFYDYAVDPPRVVDLGI